MEVAEPLHLERTVDDDFWLSDGHLYRVGHPNLAHLTGSES